MLSFFSFYAERYKIVTFCLCPVNIIKLPLYRDFGCLQKPDGVMENIKY